MKKIHCMLWYCLLVFSSAFCMVKPELSPEQIAEMISILHERHNPFPDGSHKKDLIHIIPAACGHESTYITHFAPRTIQECNDTIAKVCSEHRKILWLISHSKKCNLKERLHKQGLQPFSMPAMLLALSKTETELPSLRGNCSIHLCAMHQHIAQYALFQNNEPISEGALFFYKDWVGIVKVGTKEKYRKQGFATILMQYFLYIAQERGAQWALLESTEQAFSLYQKLGFKEVGSNIFFSRN